MAKKKADTVDMRASMTERHKALVAELIALRLQLSTCINERAHLRQFYLGRIEQAESEMEYIKALLDV